MLFFTSALAVCALTCVGFDTYAEAVFIFSADLRSSSNLPGSPGASPALNEVLNLGWGRPTLRVFIPCTFFQAWAYLTPRVLTGLVQRTVLQELYWSVLAFRVQQRGANDGRWTLWMLQTPYQRWNQRRSRG